MEGRPHKQRRHVDEDKTEDLIRIAKTPTEIQRLRLEKLIKNFDKPVSIPNPKKDFKLLQPPEFVRNVVGSSAGAGSGEYHIYRNLRKREYVRRQFNEEQAKKEELDGEYAEKVERHKREAEERTAKKREKRLKKKRSKKQKTEKNSQEEPDVSSHENSEDEVVQECVNFSQENLPTRETCDKEKVVEKTET